MGSNTWKVLMIKFKLNQHSVFLFFQHFVKVRIGNWHELGWDFAVKSKKHLIAYVIFHRFVCFQRNSGNSLSPWVSPYLCAVLQNGAKVVPKLQYIFVALWFHKFFYREEINVTVGSERDKIYWKKACNLTGVVW